MGVANATLVVAFSEDALDAGGFYLAELDDAANLNSSGETKTSFAPGDEPYIIIQHDDTLRIGRIVTTSGSIFSTGSVSRTKEQTSVFASEGDTSSLPCLGSSSTSFFYGSVSLKMDSENSTNVEAESGSFPAVVDFSVTGQFHQYQLSPNIPSLSKDQTYDVYIIIYFEAA